MVQQDLIKHYILKDQKPVKADLLTWANWFEDIDSRRVAQDIINNYRVSTVFLGLCYTFTADHKEPDECLLFETMIFPENSGSSVYAEKYQERYTTWDEAIGGHKRAIELAAKDNLE